MNCREARDQLSHYLHGDIAPAMQRRIERHLDECAGCRRELAGYRQLAALTPILREVETPAGFARELERRVLQGAGANTARRKSQAGRSGLAVFLRPAFALPALALVALLGVLLLQWRSPLPLAPHPSLQAYLVAQDVSGLLRDLNDAERRAQLQHQAVPVDLLIAVLEHKVPLQKRSSQMSGHLQRLLAAALEAGDTVEEVARLKPADLLPLLQRIRQRQDSVTLAEMQTLIESPPASLRRF